MTKLTLHPCEIESINSMMLEVDGVVDTGIVISDVGPGCAPLTDQPYAVTFLVVVGAPTREGAAVIGWHHQQMFADLGRILREHADKLDGGA